MSESKPKYIIAYELYLQGLSPKEIADKLGVKVKQVYKYLSYYKKKHGREEKHPERQESLVTKDDLRDLENGIMIEIGRTNQRIDVIDYDLSQLKKQLIELTKQVNELSKKLKELEREIERLKPTLPEIKLTNLSALASQAENIIEYRKRVVKTLSEILDYIKKKNLRDMPYIEFRGMVYEDKDYRRVCLKIGMGREICSDGRIYRKTPYYRTWDEIDIGELNDNMWSKMIEKAEKLYKAIVDYVRTGKLSKEDAEKLDELYRKLRDELSKPK